MLAAAIEQATTHFSTEMDTAMSIDKPNYTQIPNLLIDDYMPFMGEAELKVVMMMLFRTGMDLYSIAFSRADIQRSTGLSRPGTLSGLSSATTRGLVVRLYGHNPEEVVSQLEKKSPQHFIINGEPERQCNWCACVTVALEEHHYPISKADGGTETIGICANCHCEFHYLTAERYALAPRLTESQP